MLERELAALHEHGLSSDTKPDMFWTLHDGLAQSYGTTGKAHKKIEHYELAISILSNYTAPPEVSVVSDTIIIDSQFFQLSSVACNSTTVCIFIDDTVQVENLLSKARQ